VAFAGNSLLCRAALDRAGMDAASFTLVRLASGAVMLVALLRLRSVRLRAVIAAGSWSSAAILVCYAILFSLAYRSIPAGVGALVLFGAVQLTMLTAAVRAGTGPKGAAWLGVALAFGGLVALTLPGATAPDPTGVLMMALSGVGWGVYSLHGRSVTRPTEATAGNFVMATVIALPLVFFFQPGEPSGFLLASFAGAITSGVGYVLWYTVLPGLGTTRAAVLQLTVPVITAAAGVTLLGESLTTRLVLASTAILGGIFVVIRRAKRE
jgi:drug/metabolite transporter (DMT)-like permease